MASGKTSSARRRPRRPAPLLRCEAVGERSQAHPAAPALVLRGREVWVYVHESVPGASVDAFLPREVHKAWVRVAAGGRLARYTLAAAKTCSPTV